jgi:transcriptional regulator with XRE-family HTH domain
MKDLTQEQLAAKVGVNPSYISLLENNQKNPSFAIVRRICDALGISIMLVAFLLDSEHPDVAPYVPEIARSLISILKEEPELKTETSKTFKHIWTYP